MRIWLNFEFKRSLAVCTTVVQLGILRLREHKMSLNKIVGIGFDGSASIKMHQVFLFIISQVSNNILLVAFIELAHDVGTTVSIPRLVRGYANDAIVYYREKI